MSSAPRARLVGRAPAVAAFDALFARLKPGSPGTSAWIEGVDGLGKTALVAEIAARCPVPVTVARASPGIRTLYRSLTGRPAPAGDTPQLLDRLSSALAEACSVGPSVVVLEDLHQADDLTLLAWSHLLRLSHRLPVLMVGTCSPTPYRELLSRLRESVRRAGGEMVFLRPLSDADVVRLAADRLHAVPGARLSRSLKAVRGNPGAALGLLAALDAAGLLVRAGDGVDLARGGERARNGILQRFALHDLPEDQRAVLQAAALQGPRFDAAEVACAADLGLPAVAAALANATDLGILRAVGDHLVFQLGAVRTACAQTLSAAERRRFHHTAALRLAARGARPRTVAFHLGAAGELPIEAIAWRAGLDEATLLTDPALFSPVLHLPPTDRRAPMLDFWLGDYDAALRTARGLVHDLREDGELLRLSVRALIRAGRHAEAAVLCEPTTDPHLGAWHAIALAVSGEVAAARDRIRGLPPVGLTPLATATLAHARFATGRPFPTASDLESALDALALDDGAEARELRALLHGDLVRLLAQTGPAAALPAALADTPTTAAHADLCLKKQILADAAWVAYATGHWDTATALDHDVAAVVAARRAAPASLPEPNDMPRAYYEASAIHAENLGQLVEALDLRRRGLAEVLRTHPAALHGVEHVIRLAEAAAVDVPDLAASVEQAAADGLPAQTAIADLVWALLQRDPSALLTAARACGELGAVLQQAYGLEQAAVWLAESGDRRTAARLLRDAVTLYAVPGAVWDILRVDTRLKDLGVRRRTPAGHPASGWAALTPAEFRVVRLVARGLSDRAIAEELFLSQNTVHTHLARIRAKLGLRSRLQIARAAGFRADPPAGLAEPHAPPGPSGYGSEG